MEIPPDVINALQASTARDLYPITSTGSYDLPVLKTRIQRRLCAGAIR